MATGYVSALERVKQADGVLGIVWAGSAARGQADLHSDLDFYVLVSGDRRWRTSFMAGAAPVEAFYNPARQIRKYIAQGDASSMFMLAEGRVVLEHPELEALILEARQTLAAGRPAKLLASDESHTAVDEVWETRSVVGQPIHVQVAMQAVKRIVGALYQQRGWWDTKPKHWPGDLALRDAQAAGLLLAVLEAGADTLQAALEALALYVLGSLDWAESSTVPEEV
ncbi:nucleotidyltransferase domain-containing protein [Deinococcus altitudinis]|uniref:nucleotidyltransferase domain-containing protein n=1 Tax=Deinococcus altitudinis TaxID=468914 RepID=UPI0038925587